MLDKVREKAEDGFLVTQLTAKQRSELFLTSSQIFEQVSMSEGSFLYINNSIKVKKNVASVFFFLMKPCDSFLKYHFK